MKEKVIEFVKKEVVLVVATVLAIISAFVIPPSMAYMEYIYVKMENIDKL